MSGRVGFVKGLFDGIIKPGCFAIALVIAIFFAGKRRLGERIYLGVGLVSGRRGYDLELYSGFYLDYGGIYPSG